jgi:hypothetical protein
MYRPHPNECSGSDLDGDLYFLSWDEALIPASADNPMDYCPPGQVSLDHPVTVEASSLIPCTLLMTPVCLLVLAFQIFYTCIHHQYITFHNVCFITTKNVVEQSLA